VWLKTGVDPAYANFRKDTCGATILRNDYGTTTDSGWEIDHVKPVASGGTDAMDNLQPLHWENNRHKADNWPHWSRRRTS
jgi:5-methylcytosine-specific restriction endonuclease McrA